MLIHFTARADHEWATVFVAPDREGNSGTLCVNSTYGAYGYYWSNCGCPFVDFLCNIGTDYLMSKISDRVPDSSISEESVKDELTRLWQEKLISKEEKGRLWREVSDCDVCNYFTLTDLDLPEEFELENIVWTDYPIGAKQFLKVLWPAIVDKLKSGQGIYTLSEQSAESLTA